MHHSSFLQFCLAFLLPASIVGASSERPPGNKAILLSKVQSLTLRGDRLTASRRVSPIPQLECVGPSKRICKSYPIDVMRCTNAGYDYDEEDVQWTCTASLPPELKLGSTDVICEGYRDADDPWVLKGSCGVEYRLLLTDLGEKKFGRQHDNHWSEKAGRHKWQKLLSTIGDLIFFGFIAAVFVLILWPMLSQCFGARSDRRRRTPGRGWGGFGGDGGGGGGGGGGPYSDPPPPYSSYPDSSRGWRPGFWTGALGGGAAGYEFGRRHNTYNYYNYSPSTSRYPSSRRSDPYDSGEGSSRSASSRYSDTTTTSTGFGSTRRR